MYNRQIFLDSCQRLGQKRSLYLEGRESWCFGKMLISFLTRRSVLSEIKSNGFGARRVCWPHFLKHTEESRAWKRQDKNNCCQNSGKPNHITLKENFWNTCTCIKNTCTLKEKNEYMTKTLWIFFYPFNFFLIWNKDSSILWYSIPID